MLTEPTTDPCQSRDRGYGEIGPSATAGRAPRRVAELGHAVALVCLGGPSMGLTGHVLRGEVVPVAGASSERQVTTSTVRPCASPAGSDRRGDSGSVSLHLVLGIS